MTTAVAARLRGPAEGRRSAPASALDRWRERRRRGRLAIFAFHGIVNEPLAVPGFCFTPVETFRRQLQLIRATHEVLPLEDGLRALRDGRLSEPAAALTFDDGFQSVHDVALPLLREHALPASCFLATAAVGSDAALWFCRIHRAVSETPHARLEWADRRYDLSTPAKRARASASLQQRLKRMPAPALEREVDRIAGALDDMPAARLRPDSPYRMLDRAAIGALERSGLVRFGAHTHRHAILSALPAQAQREEIETSLRAVREWVARPLAVFAYPNGMACDFGREAQAILEGEGIRAALCAFGGRATAASAPMALPRICLGPRSLEWAIR